MRLIVKLYILFVAVWIVYQAIISGPGGTVLP